MRNSRVSSEGVPLTMFFLVDEGRGDPITTKIWPSSARQRNAIKMAFLCPADDGPILTAGLVALRFSSGPGPVLLRKPIAL